MRKSVVMMAAALILAVGCNDDLRTETPVIELSEVTGNQINVSSDGGLVEVEYTIVNPVEGGHVSAKADADWLETASS